jgi:hypothetical protein
MEDMAIDTLASSASSGFSPAHRKGDLATTILLG